MRTYKRKAGSRGYKTNYSTSTLLKARHKVSAGWSILKASKKFNIPYGTLYNKIHHLHTMRVGTPYRLTTETENLIVNAINSLAEWKVPLTGLDTAACQISYGQARSFRPQICQQFARNRMVEEFHEQALTNGSCF